MSYLGLAQATISTTFWDVLWVVALCGAAGGLINGLLADKGLPIPTVKEGILRLGFVGNIIIGAFAAGVSWGSYGPVKDFVVVGQATTSGQQTFNLNLAALVGAALAGAAGARLITSEIDKRFFKTAAVEAAAKNPNPQTAQDLQQASPVEALRLVRAM